MSKTQQCYTTGEQELLSIVETLKEFKNILLGQQIVIHSDHKNILYGSLSNDRITRWHLLLEEYGPEFRHVRGTDNVVADALSRLEANETINMESQHQVSATTMCMLTRDESYNSPEANDPEAMAICFASRKDMELETFPMNPQLIEKEQQKDKQIQASKQKSPTHYGEMKVERASLITHDGKIVLPKSLTERVIDWYHTYLVHPGETRMEATIRQIFTWPGLRNDVHKHVKTCHLCQLNKKVRRNYGKLPPKEAETSEPWDRVNVDMIGPFAVKTPTQKLELRAFTMIDPTTGWFEVKDISEPSAEACQNVFDDVWIARYPRPQYIGFDNGSENKAVFKELCDNMGIKTKLSTTYNPQCNGIIERIHQVLNDSLRTFELEKRELNEKDPWAPFLTAVAYAIRSTFHTTLQATPAQLVFGRDMILPLKFKADWARIRQQRQEAIIKNNIRENKSRIYHEYKAGDKVLLTKPGIVRKLSAPRTGPHEVLGVYPNGTVLLQRGVIQERVNIRRITPYFEDTTIGEANALLQA